MPLPPCETQTKIAEAVEVAERKIASEESRYRALDALFQSLLHNLMTGKVRVRDLAADIAGESHAPL
jgi:type I restriction enzyme, S subunit